MGDILGRKSRVPFGHVPRSRLRPRLETGDTGVGRVLLDPQETRNTEVMACHDRRIWRSPRGTHRAWPDAPPSKSTYNKSLEIWYGNAVVKQNPAVVVLLRNLRSL